MIEAVRGRMGLEPDDESKDAMIAAMTPRERLCKVCGWHLGDESWAGTIIGWMKECGYTVKEAAQ